MDFFESQALAHRRTKWLVAYFVLAVLGIIATIHVTIALATGLSLTDWNLLLLVAAGVVFIVTVGALFRISELSRGGGVVAQMLGGRLVEPHTTDLREQQLRNVVEEMALASGMPVPDIYVLDNEPALNAFAAGNTTGDAVVAVTRGTLENLTRDELQGVIGHEFSHILNGDMRMNIRLMGVLNGILLLAILGRLVFEFGGRGSVNSGSDGRKSAVPLFAVGAALWLIGSIGVLFANLIKAAVSRQREFLADASAVQFTRNPEGISSALYKIGQLSARLQTPRASEASHMFFGNALGASFSGLFATHPPIEERIRAINPGFDASRVESAPATDPSTPPPLPPTKHDVAGAMLAAIPAFARQGARETASAVPMIYALLMSADPATRERQLAAIDLPTSERAEVGRDVARSGEIGDAITLMDLCLPALRQLSDTQYATFRKNVSLLIRCDGEVDLFEFVLHKALTKHVDHYFTKSRGTPVRYNSIEPLLADVALVLRTLASYSGGADAAWNAGAKALGLQPGALPVVPDGKPDFAALDAALDRLAESSIPVRRTILDACNQAVRQDGVIHPHEAALLRVISDVLGAPRLDPENIA